MKFRCMTVIATVGTLMVRMSRGKRKWRLLIIMVGPVGLLVTRSSIPDTRADVTETVVPTGEAETMSAPHIHLVPQPHWTLRYHIAILY